MLVLFAGVAQASTINVDWGAVRNVGITYNGNTKTVGTTQFDVLIDGEFLTFGYCIDLDGNIYKNQNYLVDVLDDTGYKHASWLMDTYADGADDSYKRAGLQLAIWESIYKETFNYNPTGLVGTYYTNYFSPTYSTNLNYEYNILNHVNDDYQNLLVRGNAVPEPATLFLVGFGLLFVSGTARNRIK